MSILNDAEALASVPTPSAGQQALYLDSTTNTWMSKNAAGASSSIGLSPLRSYLAGYLLSNDLSTPNTIIDIGAGSACSDDFINMIGGAAITKSIGATWAVGSGNGGLDVGAVLASTWYHVYVIERLDTGVVDALLSQAPNVSGNVTATSASPAVFSWGSALPFQNGSPVVLGGTVPTGFVAGTQYFVVASNQATGTFELSLTQGGAAINSSSTGAGVTATCAPVLPASYTRKRRIGSIKTDASSHILVFSQNGDEFLWKLPVTFISNATASATAAAAIVTAAPMGVEVWARFTAVMTLSTAATTLLFFALDQGTQVSNSPGGYLDMDVTSTATVDVTDRMIRTNLSAQIGWVAGASPGANGIFAACYGYIDKRGRDL